jgi:hypothetical protein
MPWRRQTVSPLFSGRLDKDEDKRIAVETEFRIESPKGSSQKIKGRMPYGRFAPT